MKAPDTAALFTEAHSMQAAFSQPGTLVFVFKALVTCERFEQLARERLDTIREPERRLKERG